MAILIWKCKGYPVIIAAEVLGFKVGTYLLNCVLYHLLPTILPKLGFTLYSPTSVDITTCTRRPRSVTGIYSPKKERARGCWTVCTGTRVTNPHGITGYLQKSLPGAKHKAALLSRPGRKHSAGAGVRLKAAPISML